MRKTLCSTAVAPGGHNDIEAIRLPVYSFFLKEFLGWTMPVTRKAQSTSHPRTACLLSLRAYRWTNSCHADRRGIDPVASVYQKPSHAGSRQRRIREVTKASSRGSLSLFSGTSRADFDAQWSEKTVVQGRAIQRVSFTSLDGLRDKGHLFASGQRSRRRVKLPALLLADHRQGIPVWGNEQPIERNQWGDRAVLIVETIDHGSRALERNLRSYNDNDPLHHMKRQAMVTGTTLESIQMYELQRASTFLRTLPNVDAGRESPLRVKAEMGVNCMYAALLDGKVQRIVLHSPTASHLEGPHYLGVLRYTDIPEVAALLADKLSVYGEIPDGLRSLRRCESLQSCLE